MRRKPKTDKKNREVGTQTEGLCSPCERILHFGIPVTAPSPDLSSAFSERSPNLAEPDPRPEEFNLALGNDTHEELVRRVQSMHREEVLHYVLEKMDE